MSSSGKRDRRSLQSGVKEDPSPKMRKVSKIPLPKCDIHEDSECMFWCDKCGMAMCMLCADIFHGSHQLQLLRHVIKDKAQTCIRRLKTNVDKIDDDMSQCDQEIQFYKMALLIARNKKLVCEGSNERLDVFKENLPSLSSFVEGTDVVSQLDVDVNALEELMKVLSRYSEFYANYSCMLFAFGRLSTSNEESFGVSGQGATFRGFCRKSGGCEIMDYHEIHHFSFRFRCTSSLMWPRKAAIKISTFRYDNENDRNELAELEKRRDKAFVTKTGFWNDLVFVDSTSEHELKAQAFHENISFVIEIHPRHS